MSKTTMRVTKQDHLDEIKDHQDIEPRIPHREHLAAQGGEAESFGFRMPQTLAVPQIRIEVFEGTGSTRELVNDNASLTS